MGLILNSYISLLDEKGLHNLNIYINEVTKTAIGTVYGEQGALKEIKYKDGTWEIIDRPVAVNFFTFESLLEKYVKYLENGKDAFDNLIIRIDEVSQFGDGIVELKNGTPSGCWFERETGKWF